MVTITDVVEYVLHTPDNTNPMVLRSLLNALLNSQFTPIDEAVITEAAVADATYFGSNVYNKKGSNQKLTRETDNDVATHYYVLVAEDVGSDIRVQFGDKIVSADDIMLLSVGNNSFVEDVYYYVEDGNCYAAFPVIMLEGLTIGDTVIYDADKGTKLTVTGTKIVGEGEMIDQGEGNYIANITKRNSYIDFGLQGVQENEMILSKKIYNGKLSYGFIKADEKVDNIPGIGYYPFIWCNTEEKWADIADVATTAYTLFSPNLKASVSVYVEARKNGAIEPEEEVIYDGGDVQGN